jgi:ribonuclease BN (tRNA processing enzyme)
VESIALRFLGSGDALGSGGRFQTCLHLSGLPVGGLLIDCGASSLIAMKRAGVDPSGIAWVVLSHLHGDHFGGLPFMILDGQFQRRTRPLLVAGPPGVQARVMAAMEVLFPGSSTASRGFSVEFLELPARSATVVGPATVTAFEVAHLSGAPSYALRLQYGGKSLAYSGDTEWTESLVEAATGVDLFVCEAYFFAKKVKYHLDYQTLVTHRDRLGCRRLILTHAHQDLLDRGPLGEELADDLTVVTL